MNRGGVRRISELGEELRCLACGEYWPADAEFFVVGCLPKGRLSARCIACVRERNWGGPRHGHLTFSMRGKPAPNSST
ncbi:MAG: hypothetical protein V4724_29645 [Pseudomonadota bacterium]